MSYPFNLNEIAQSLHYISQHDSSRCNLDESFDFSRANPIHILLHNEILKLNKDDVDNFSSNRNFYKNFYQLSLSTKKSILFTPFLKIGAFEDNLHYYTKWINDNLTCYGNIDKKHDLCFQLEYSIKYKESPTLHQKFHENTTFLDFIYYSSHTLDKEDLLKIFNEFEPNLKLSQYFLNKSSFESTSSINLFQLMIENDPTIVKNIFINDIVDCLKPKPTDGSYHSHHMSSSCFNKISFLLDYKFQFNETQTINNDNLFIYTVKTGSKVYIETILPHLNNIVPPNGDWDSQNKYIDELSSTYKLSSLVTFIQSIYNKNLLSLDLNKKTTNNSSNKLKI